MNNNHNNNHYISNADKELLKFLEAKSYKSLRPQNEDNIKTNFKNIESNQNQSTNTLYDKNTDTIQDNSLNNTSEISNYINTKDDERYSKQDNDITPNSEELIYKTLIFLLSLCKTLELKNEDITTILNSTRIFLIQSLKQIEEEHEETKKLICFNLKRLLGEDFKNKILLIKRAYTWLGLNKLNNSEEYLNFLTKMSELGNMISEDQGVQNEQHSFILTKEEAKNRRNELFSDDKFRVALTNKMHPAHKEILKKLRSLNKIIIS